MDSQRRHELKTNTLAEALAGVPNRGKQFATTFIISVCGAILVGLLIRYRINASQQRAARAADNLAVAWDEINELKKMAFLQVDPSQPVELFKDVTSRLDLVTLDVGDSNPTLSAEALLARGELDWDMAGLTAATTQPSLGMQSSAELLKGAQGAYSQVISGFPQQTFAVTTARLGLGAVAENQGDWQAARTQYHAIVDDAQSAETMKSMAKIMLTQVDQLQTPPIIGAPMPATTQPVLAPSSLNIPATPATPLIAPMPTPALAIPPTTQN